MFVCSITQYLKTNDPKVFKLGIGKITLGYPTKDMVWGQKVKAQGHEVAKHFRRSGGSREFALYRVNLDDEMMFIFCRTTTYTSKWVASVPGR